MSTKERIIDWLNGSDKGLSSKYLCNLYLTGSEELKPNYPFDPSDFGRCYRFLELLTLKESCDLLFKASKVSKEWGAIAANWDRMVELYEEEYPSGKAPKLYVLMKSIGL
ncbi:MAG: hypothetical protein WC477_07490 [Patescibacteria group bacterium]